MSASKHAETLLIVFVSPCGLQLSSPSVYLLLISKPSFFSLPLVPWLCSCCHRHVCILCGKLFSVLCCEPWGYRPGAVLTSTPPAQQGVKVSSPHCECFLLKCFICLLFPFCLPFPTGPEWRQSSCCYCLDNHRNYPLLLLYLQSVKPSALPHQVGQVKTYRNED